MMNEIIKSIEKEKIIAIVRGVDREKLLPLAEALYKGGVRLMEITYDATGKTTDEETAGNIGMLCQAMEGRMYIGAGTVLTPRQVELTARAGGKFIISPDTNPSVIEKTKELGLVSMPGALTPSEITEAHRYGADFVKLFPISNLGLSYVKAVMAPLSHIKILAVGGITPENMGDYIRAGVCGFGIGTSIVDKKLIESGDFEGLCALAEKFVRAARA